MLTACAISNAGSTPAVGNIDSMNSDDASSRNLASGLTDASWNFVDKFITDIEGRIDGWLFKADTLCIWYVDSVQKVNNVPGDLCEIGVYHGKSLLLMANLRRPDETIYRFDDFSGVKERTVREVLEAYAFITERVTIISGDTQQLEADDLKQTITAPLRFLHVDGGHTYDECMHDLLTFQSLLGEGAVIAVDDYFDREYPGVSSAVNAYCRSPEGRSYRPFMMGQNKIYLCQDSMAARYQRGLIERDAFNAQLGAESMQDGVVFIPFSRYPLSRGKLEELIA